ncbi:MAG TPA: anthranilate synthase component I [Dehalococcoidia bacterium]|nr:anthranilate synthase component I [Dehalococcoidia bacterium]
MQLSGLNNLCPKREQINLVPVFRELPADLETPVSVFLKLRKTSPCFLLESVERGEQLGRYSFIGTNPYLVVQTSQGEGIIRHKQEVSRVTLGMPPKGLDPLHLVQSLLAQHEVAKVSGLPRFFGGAVGYLSYDAVRFFERLPDCPEDELQLPDSAFLFTDTLVIFDHVQHKMKLVSNVPGGVNNRVAHQEAQGKIEAMLDALNSPLPSEPQTHFPVAAKETPPLTSNFTPAQFADMVKVAKEYILKGDAFQIVLSQRLRRQTRAEPFSIYRALRMLNPSPYMFYLDFNNFQLIGSSPEMLVKLEEGQAETRPIAGTKPRGKNNEEDEAIIATLLADPKERAEHTMLVDLGRNDIGRVSRYGSVRVPQFMGTEKYSHVIHIVSSVLSELKEGYNAFDLLRACFPAGTVSGAPKVRAMEIIAELEGTKRGPYAGAVGYFGFGGNMDTCITIRTIVMIGDTVYFQGGAGIVADSEPMREYEETLNKIKVLEEAVRLAESWKTRDR